MITDATPLIPIGDLSTSERGAFKIGPFGSSLKKSELVDHGVPVLGIENVLANRMAWTLRRFVSPTKFEQLADYAVRPGDILITTMGTIGRAAVVPDRKVTAIIDSHLFRMRVDSQRILPRYLAYALNSSDLTRQLDKKSRGAIMDGLNTTILKECVLRVPSIRKQETVLAALDAASNVVRMHRFALEMSEDLLGAMFLEMFGDPLRNPMGWPKKELAGLCDRFSDGPFGSNLKSEHYRSRGVRVIRLQNIGVGQFVDDDKAFISSEHFEPLRRNECLPGDVLIGTLGDPNLRACLQPPNIQLAINKADCVRARLKPGVASPQWFCGLLNCPSTLRLIPGLVHGQTRSRVSMGQLAELPVPVPPLATQISYSNFTLEAEDLLRTQTESLRQAEHLFQTLLHEAFGDTG